MPACGQLYVTNLLGYTVYQCFYQYIEIKLTKSYNVHQAHAVPSVNTYCVYQLGAQNHRKELHAEL